MIKGSIQAQNVPAAIPGTFSLLAIVRNGSSQAWESTGPNPVHVSYHWLDEDWNMVIFDGKRTLLPAGGLPPSSSTEVAVTIDSPTNAGHYHLSLSLVQEGVCWFETTELFRPHTFKVECSSGHLPAVKNDTALRLAIVGSPRSGNVWLNRVLSHLLSLAPCYAHTPHEVAWGALPERSILQLHWSPKVGFKEQLEGFGFVPVVLQRHPLDLLISILHFCRHEPQTAHWLQGYAGDESSIVDATPVDRAFVDYACSHRAAALLAVSNEWANQAGTIVVRYEKLVAEPAEAVCAILRKLGRDTDLSSIAAVLEDNSLSSNRKKVSNSHFWMGTPGLWRRLLLAEDVSRIAHTHRSLFAAGCYDVNPDDSLTAAASLKLWHEISRKPVKQLSNGVPG